MWNDTGSKINSSLIYGVSKAAIIHLTKYLASIVPKNIRVNCISPGGIKDMQSNLFIKRYKNSCNSKGLLDGKDISKLILFLLSEDSKYISGQNLIIDDGWTL